MVCFVLALGVLGVAVLLGAHDLHTTPRSLQLAPVLGAFAAAAWYRITNENEFGRQVVQGSRRASTFGAVAPAVQEFAGTLFVAFATALAFAHRLSATSSKGWTYGIMGPGITYAVVVYLGAHVSGSHYNPALTLVTVLSRKPFGAPMKLAEFSRYSLPVYVVSQVLGALFGYMAASQLATIEFGITYTCCGGRVFGVELIGTMLLRCVLCVCACLRCSLLCCGYPVVSHAAMCVCVHACVCVCRSLSPKQLRLPRLHL